MRRETENVRRKTVKTQNETRENNMMFVNNEEMKSPETPVGAQLAARIRAANPSRSLAALLLGAWLFAPQAALAQNECGVQTGDTVTCTPGDYNTGITYTSLGDLTLEVPSGSVELRVFDNGINVTGAGSDNITFDSSSFTSRTIRGTDDAVIDYLSDTGNISIQTGSVVTGSGSGLLDAIRAESLSDGNIDITTGGFVGIGNSSISPNAENAIKATTAGGDIDITVLDSVNLSAISAPDNSNGITAQTSGAGTIDITLAGDEFDGVGAGQNGTAIHAVAGSGDINLDLNGSVSLPPTGGDVRNAIGVHTNTAGTAFIDIGGNSRGIYGNVAAIRSAGNNVVVNLPSSGTLFDDSLEQVSGIHSALDFSALTGHAEVTVGANRVWDLGLGTDPQNVFSGGDDVVTVLPGGIVNTENLNFSRGSCSDCVDAPVTVTFGAGSDTFNNAGILMIAPTESGSVFGFDGDFDRISHEGELRFEGLETFNNSGEIYLGTRIGQNGNIVGNNGFITQEGQHDDMLAMPGADFVGSGDSRIYVDVFLNNVGNPDSSCDASFRDADGNFAGADCIDLRGGTASGHTEIVFKRQITGDRGALNPHGFLVVDLAGGSADPDAFVVSPESDSYSPQFGGVIDNGLFFYPLAYDAETQQFRLYGQPSSASHQIVILGNAVNDLWHTSTGAWFGRRVDQRDIALESGGGSAWVRVAASSAERDVITPITAGTQVYEFDNSYMQDDSTLTIGRDFIFRSAGDRAWLIGGMAGYARSRVDFDKYPSNANLEGPQLGVYGSLTMGDFYLDAAVNGIWLDAHYDAPVLQLRPEGTKGSTDVESIGAQVEAGWGGLQFGRLGIEPLASLSYVTTDVEDVFVPAEDPTRGGGNFEFDDPTSFRGGLGARLSVANVLPSLVPTDVSLTARAVEEFEGDSTATISSTGPIPVDQTDTFDGTFVEVTGSVSVHNAAKTVAGYLNVDGTFESDYESVGVEAGFRYQW